MKVGCLLENQTKMRWPETEKKVLDSIEEGSQLDRGKRAEGDDSKAD